MPPPLRVFVETSDRYLWTLKPFAYLFNIYWSTLQPVVVAGYTIPGWNLPSNFVYNSISPKNFPAERWSDGMIQFLTSVPDEYFVFMLCDYWLVRTADLRGVAACYDYIIQHPDVLRIDLTSDRLYAGGMRDADMWGCYDIIETPHGTPYQMSTQAAIWNKRLFLELLEPGKSAWEVEIQTMPPPNMRVLGTRQYPVRYANAILKGNIDEPQLALVPDPHNKIVRDMIPRKW